MSTPTKDGPDTIVITGGLGNLGSKLCRHLLAPNDGSTPYSPRYRIILLEHPKFIDTTKPLPHPDAVLIPCDLGNLSDETTIAELNSALKGADAVIHFSAVNPYPNATWSHSAQSMDHTFNIFELAVQNKVRRVIFASSNHVMGGYKDDDEHGPSSVKPDSDPRVGTVPLDEETLKVSGDARAYAAAKLAGERLAMTLGNMYAPDTTFVVLRIGWCQPGENLPETLSAKGSPPDCLLEGGNAGAEQHMSEGDKKDELWFKRMWLSNRDFLSYFDAAISLDVPTKEDAGSGSHVHRNVRKGFTLVNAMSNNSGAKWNLADTEKLLCVVSTDDSLIC